MAKAETGPQTQKVGRVDTMRPPPSLPDASPFERMTELLRRVLAVPKSEAVPTKKKKRKRH